MKRVTYVLLAALLALVLLSVGLNISYNKSFNTNFFSSVNSKNVQQEPSTAAEKSPEATSPGSEAAGAIVKKDASNTFIGSTTNLGGVSDRSRVQSLTLETVYGKVTFLDNVDTRNLVLDRDAKIGNFYASMNSEAISALSNSRAEVSLKNVNCRNVKIYSRDGFYSSAGDIIGNGNLCNENSNPYCKNIRCENSVLTFEVPHFTGYASSGTTNLTIWDEDDAGMPYAHGKGVFINQTGHFYANYTDSGVIINDSEAELNWTEGFHVIPMTFNATKQLWEMSTQLNVPMEWTYDYWITANSTSHDNLTAHDNLTILACITPAVGTTYYSNTLLCPGEYELNISSGGFALNLGGSNIYLDCNGASLIGNHSLYSKGVYATNVSNVIIRNCRIKDYFNGILFDNSTYNVYNMTVEHNNISCDAFGVIFYSAIGVDVANNQIFNTTPGIYSVYSSNSSNIVIEQNNFYENNVSHEVSADYFSNNISILFNNFTANSSSSYAIFVVNSSEIVIKNNTFSGQYSTGIMFGFNSTDFVAKFNTFIDVGLPFLANTNSSYGRFLNNWVNISKPFTVGSNFDDALWSVSAYNVFEGNFASGSLGTGDMCFHSDYISFIGSIYIDLVGDATSFAGCNYYKSQPNDLSNVSRGVGVYTGSDTTKGIFCVNVSNCNNSVKCGGIYGGIKQTEICYPICPDGSFRYPCTTPEFCGNGRCSVKNGETCNTCKQDCGECNPICGNDIIERGEVCDGTNFGDYNCSTWGWNGGTLLCSGCKIISTYLCTYTPTCGDSVCSPGEDCGICPSDCGVCPACNNDGICDPDTELCGQCNDCGACPVEVCGDNICNPSTEMCKCPECGCPSCPNSVVDPGEQCDGTDLSGATCANLGLGTGDLSCTAGCMLDTSGCSNTVACDHDNVKDSGEQCDGTDLGVLLCSYVDGFEGGELSCTSDCEYDTSKCTKCGDGICSLGESCGTCSKDCGVCHGCNNNGVCQPKAPFRETCSCSDCTPFCTPQCNIDGVCTPLTETCSNCAPDCGTCPSCGDNIVNGLEPCDNNKFGAVDQCTDLPGYVGGILTCTASCALNLSQCVPDVDYVTFINRTGGFGAPVNYPWSSTSGDGSGSVGRGLDPGPGSAGYGRVFPTPIGYQSEISLALESPWIGYLDGSTLKIDEGESLNFSVVVLDHLGRRVNISWYYDEDFKRSEWNEDGELDSYSYTFDKPGKHIIGMFASNDDNYVTYAFWIVSVRETGENGTVKLTNAQQSDADLKIYLDNNITFSAKLVDSQGNNVDTDWYLNNATLKSEQVASGSTVSYEHNFTVPGDYMLELVAHGTGNTSSAYAYNYWNVAVNYTDDGTDPPNITEYTSNVYTTWLSEGDNATFKVKLVDDLGSNLDVKWLVDGVVSYTQTISSGSYSQFSHNFTVGGDHKVEVFAYDNQDNYVYAFWDFQIEAIPTDVTPYITSYLLTPDQKLYDINSTITFDITSEDVEASSLNITWIVNDNTTKTETISSGATSSLTYTFDKYGENIVKAFIEDNSTAGNKAWIYYIIMVGNNVTCDDLIATNNHATHAAYDSDNITWVGVTSRGSSNGIKVTNTSNVTIVDALLCDSYYCVQLRNSRNVTILDSEFYNCTIGLSVKGSREILLNNSNLHHNSLMGIDIEYGVPDKFDTVTNLSDDVYADTMTYSNDVNIIGNIINKNPTGLQVWNDSANTSVFHNRFINSTSKHVYVYLNSSDVKLWNNTYEGDSGYANYIANAKLTNISGQSYVGYAHPLKIENSPGFTVSGNNFDTATTGLTLQNSSGRIENNTFNSMQTALSITDGSYNITDNAFNNSDTAASISGASNTWFWQNNITNINNGVQFIQINGLHVLNNMIKSVVQGMGLYFETVDDSVVLDNIINISSYGMVAITMSNSNVARNTVENAMMGIGLVNVQDTNISENTLRQITLPATMYFISYSPVVYNGIPYDYGVAYVTPTGKVDITMDDAMLTSVDGSRNISVFALNMTTYGVLYTGYADNQVASDCTQMKTFLQNAFPGTTWKCYNYTQFFQSNGAGNDYTYVGTGDPFTLAPGTANPPYLEVNRTAGIQAMSGTNNLFQNNNFSDVMNAILLRKETNPTIKDSIGVSGTYYDMMLEELTGLTITNVVSGTKTKIISTTGSATNWTLGNSEGSITYPSLTISNDANTKLNMTISNNFIEVLSDLIPDFNASALLTLNGIVGISHPILFRNGVECEGSICTNQNYNITSQVFTGDVSQFTSYTVSSNTSALNQTQLTIFDSAEGTYAQPGDFVIFYANYSNVTGGYLAGADCNITFNDSSAMMTGDGVNYYNYTRNFTYEGIYQWNVSCNLSGYDALNTTDDVNISTGGGGGSSLSYLVVFDESNGTSKNANVSITFYANYTNSTGDAISTGTCIAYFDDSTSVALSTFFGGLYRGTKVGGFAAEGIHQWNATCTDPSYQTATAFDDVNISGTSAPSAVPEFSDFAALLILAITLSGFFIMRYKQKD